MQELRYIEKEISDENKASQPLKADSPISVTLEGMVKLVNPLQPLKAYPPIQVTLEGMVKLVNPLQPLKA